jgi:hypothetical protein
MSSPTSTGSVFDMSPMMRRNEDGRRLISVGAERRSARDQAGDLIRFEKIQKPRQH